MGTSPDFLPPAAGTLLGTTTASSFQTAPLGSGTRYFRVVGVTKSGARGVSSAAVVLRLGSLRRRIAAEAAGILEPMAARQATARRSR